MEKDKLTEIVDEFVEHYYNGDYEVNSLSSLITTKVSDALQAYVEAKSDMTRLKSANPSRPLYELVTYGKAKECLKRISDVRRLGIVKETQSLVTKLKKAMELIKEGDDEVSQLRDENAKLQKEILRLKQLNEDLHKAFERLGATRINGSEEEGQTGQ